MSSDVNCYVLLAKGIAISVVIPVDFVPVGAMSFAWTMRRLIIQKVQQINLFPIKLRICQRGFCWHSWWMTRWHDRSFVTFGCFCWKVKKKFRNFFAEMINYFSRVRLVLSWSRLGLVYKGSCLCASDTQVKLTTQEHPGLIFYYWMLDRAWF